MPVNQPYVFGCWYGYDQDCVSLTAFNVGLGNSIGSGYNMCNQTAPGGNTYYHNGSGTYPVANDIVYLSNSTSNPFNGGTGIQTLRTRAVLPRLLRVSNGDLLTTGRVQNPRRTADTASNSAHNFFP